MSEPGIKHEYDAPPMAFAQELSGKVRVVVWARCARCRRFICNYHGARDGRADRDGLRAADLPGAAGY